MAQLVRRLPILAAAFAAAAVLVAGAFGQPTASGLPTLYVAYNMNCTFSIATDQGAAVGQIPPGTYQVQITTPQVFADVDLTGVTDMTACKSFVQFQITGPGVNLYTTLQDGDEDYGLIDETFLPAATYTAVDLNQPSVARQVFTTASSGSPVIPQNPDGTGATTGKGTTQSDIVGSKSSSTATGTAAVARGTLLATVAASGKVSLSFEGRPVTTLKSGRYTIKVTDHSKKSGFIVQETGNTATTLSTGGFTGSRSASLTLAKGQWFYYPSFLGAKTYFLVSA